MTSKGALKVATYQRSTLLCKERFNKIKAYVDKLADELNDQPLSTVHNRVLNNYLTELRKKSADFQGNLARVIDTASAEEIATLNLSDDQDVIGDLFISITASIEALLPKEEPVSPLSGTSHSITNASAMSSIKLPKLNLKVFDGCYTNWATFINLFDTTIHHNTSLSNVLKQQYLLSCLTGEALKLVSSLNISAANYIIAYNLLRDRYHNTQHLITLHLNTLLDLPRLTSGAIKQMRSFINTFFENTEALKALQCDITISSNPLLSAHLLRLLDNDLRRKLESYRKSTTDQPSHSLPTVTNIIDFLNEECSHFEDAVLHDQGSPHSKANYGSSFKVTATKPRTAEYKSSPPKRNVSLLTTQSSSNKSHSCFVCDQPGHKVYTCDIFKQKTPHERYTLIKGRKRCVSCLGAHSLKECSSKATCFKCNQKHHTMLHFDNTPSRPISPVKQEAVVTMAHKTSNSPHSDYTVLLGTALVQLTSSNGHSHIFRALLDSGSMVNFISESAAQLIGGNRIKSSHPISGISQAASYTQGHINATVSSLSGKNIVISQPLHILSKISANLPRTKLAPEVFEKVKPFVLADPTFHLPGCIDVLLGGAIFPELLTHETHHLGPNMPYVIGTHLGFVVMGKAPCLHEQSVSTLGLALLTTNDVELHNSLQKFWQLEEPPHCT